MVNLIEDMKDRLAIQNLADDENILWEDTEKNSGSKIRSEVK